MGESNKPLFEPTFNRAVKVRGGQDRLTSDAGVLLLLREADHRLDLTRSLAAELYDRRDPERIRYTLVELLRERLYALAQGYNVQDDADELAHDPAMRLAAWDRPGKRVGEERLASQPKASSMPCCVRATCIRPAAPSGSFWRPPARPSNWATWPRCGSTRALPKGRSSTS